MPNPSCCVSIVSHGQGALVGLLLDDLERLCIQSLEVVVVVNVPEDECYLERSRNFSLKVVRNRTRRGFGANHNAAFAISTAPVFVVCNPDIRLDSNPLPPLLAALGDERVGICGPKVLSPEGRVEDFARTFPSMWSIAAKALGRQSAVEYVIGDVPIAVDWIAGMFMAIRRDVYSRLGGFDERYFLYYEDVDLCRRVHEARLGVVVVPAASVIHHARRASHRNVRHLYWHATSLARYLATRRAI